MQKIKTALNGCIIADEERLHRERVFYCTVCFEKHETVEILSLSI